MNVAIVVTKIGQKKVQVRTAKRINSEWMTRFIRIIAVAPK